MVRYNLRAVTRYVAFLRAVNVGGRIVKMEGLRRLFSSLGFRDVRTYIQSGNVLFDASQKDSAAISRKIEERLQKSIGYEIRVFLRTITQLQEMLNRNPFKKWKASAELKLYVTFLAEELKEKPHLPLSSANHDLEVISIEGCDVYSVSRPYKGRFGFPNHFIEAAFKVQATTRNWETVKKMMKTAI